MNSRNEKRRMDHRPAEQSAKRPQSDEASADRRDQNDERRLIEGKNAVVEAIRAGTPIDRIYLSCPIEGPVSYIVSAGRAAGAVIVETDRRKLDGLSRTGNHQGVIAVAAVKEYCDIPEILRYADECGEAPFIILCDGITDDHNLGAIIRTAEALGAHGIVLPRRRSAGVDAIVSRTSAGAVEHMRIARVANMSTAIRELKEAGVWVYGTAADGSSTLYQTDLTGPCAIVVGSEGEGMSRLTARDCDFIMNIPMKGLINSLNASVSAGVVMYELSRQRLLAGEKEEE